MKITLTFQLETDREDTIQGVKDALAMLLEDWGDVRLLWLGKTADPEQIRLPDC